MPTKDLSNSSYYDLDNNVGFLVSDAHRLVTSVVDKVMSPLGLTRSQLRVLLFLIRRDGFTQVELADQLGIGKVAIGGLLDRLEDKKLVVRKSNPDDKRARRVYLTPEVEKLYQPMMEHSNGLMEKLLDGLSEKEQQVFVDNLLRLKENCEKILEED